MRLVKKIWNSFEGLASDTLWGAAFDLASLITTLLLFLFFQETLSTSQYGSYASMYSMTGPLGAFAFAGPGLAMVQRRLRYNDPADQTLKSFLSYNLAIGVLAVIVATVLGLWIIKFLTFTEIFLLATAELLGNSTISMVSRLVQASSGFAAMSRVNLGMVASKFIVLAALVNFDSRLGDTFFPQVNFGWSAETLTVRNLVLGLCVSYLLYALWLVRFHLPRHGYTVAFAKPDVKTAKAGAVFGIPMAAASLQTDGDKVALEAFRGGELADGSPNPEVGVYAAAYRVVTLGLLPLRVLDAAAFQRFLPDNETEKGYHLKRARKFAALMFAVSVAIAGVIYLAQPLATLLLKGEFQAPALEILPWLLLFIPLVALSGTPMNGLLGLGRQKERSYVYLSSSLLSLILYTIFIPPFGWQGAVIATVLGELYLAVASWSAMVHYQRVADKEIDERAATLAVVAATSEDSDATA